MLDINKKNILLKETKTSKYYLIESSIEENEELSKGLTEECNEENKTLIEDFFKKYPYAASIEVNGKSKNASNAIARHYIPIESKVDKRELIEIRYRYWTETEYKCYCRGKKIIENNLIIHEDALSSLKCAIYRIGSPEYCFIIKINNEEFDTVVEQLKINYATINNRDTELCTESTNVEEPT